MSREIGKLITRTYYMLQIDISIGNLLKEPIIEYNSVLEKLLIEIKNDYYKSKTVLYNDQVLTLKEHRSRNMICVLINETTFVSEIHKVDKFII